MQYFNGESLGCSLNSDEVFGQNKPKIKRRPGECSLSPDNFCGHRSGTPGPCHMLVDKLEKINSNCSLNSNNFCSHRNNRGPCPILAKEDIKKFGCSKSPINFCIHSGMRGPCPIVNNTGCSVDPNNLCIHQDYALRGPCPVLLQIKRPLPPSVLSKKYIFS